MVPRHGEQEPVVLQVVEAVRQLQNELEYARRIPFTSLLLLDEIRIHALLAQLQEAIPQELFLAQSILDEHDRILAEARAQAERIVAEAEERASQEIEKSEIVNRAHQMADEIIRDAQEQEAEARRRMIAYTRDSLRSLKELLQQELMRVEQDLETLDAYAREASQEPVRLVRQS